MTDTTREWLKQQSDEAYRSFQHKLLPGVENYMGVRLPILKSKAKQLAKQDWKTEFAQADLTFEEVMLRGMTIGALNLPVEQTVSLVKAFVPCIDNWAVCDSFCASLRQVRKHKAEFLPTIKEVAASKREFEARFAAVMLLCYYKEPQDMPQSLALYAQITQADYYAQMGLAWGYSVFAATDFEMTLQAMEQAALSVETWNKALQKMRESRRISPQQKEIAAQKKRSKKEEQP